MFTAALLTIAKIWKQPKYPSTNDWFKKIHVSTQWNTTQPQKRMTDLEMIIRSEVSQTEKDKYYTISLIHGI